MNKKNKLQRLHADSEKLNVFDETFNSSESAYGETFYTEQAGFEKEETLNSRNPLKPRFKLMIFFDGNCGLCHKFIYFAVSKMKGEPFLFASQESRAFQNISNRFIYPADSIVVFLTKKEQLFSRGEAIRLIFSYLRHPWKVVAYLLYLIPSFLLNFGYTVVAKWRHRFFKRPEASCPIIPLSWQKFFLK